MPPVNKSEILAAQRYFGVPLMSEQKLHGEIVDIQDRDIRLGAIGIAHAMERRESDDNKSLRTKLHLLYNLENFIDGTDAGLIESQLRDHQQTVFQDIYKFIATPPEDSNGKTLSKGFIKLPTGSGKTAIFSTLVDVLNKPIPGQTNRLKTLVLVPKVDLIDQTIGINGKRGFAQFGQETTTSRYMAFEKDTSGDAVIMTYQSLIGAVKTGAVNSEMFDLIICDEAHRALGDETSKAVEEVIGTNIAIALTATPEFKRKSVENLFPAEIHSMELREAIEIGLLASVQCFALTSDSKIETITQSQDFTQEELSGLIENEWRNQKAIEFAKDFVSRGIQGLISCVPGEEVLHARSIADQLNNEFIVDHQSGELRRIRAKAVAGDTLDRQDIYSAFERGDIDVLTYVDVLTEGWDSEKAKFLINLRPTTSPVNAVQRLGRILRKTDDEQTATIIEFIDKTDKPLQTFFHAMGLKTIEQGKVLGVRKSDPDNNPGVLNGTEKMTHEQKNLPADILELLKQVNHIEIASLIVERKDAEPAEEGDITLGDFAKIHHVSRSTLLKALQNAEITPKIARFNRFVTEGLTPSMQEQALEALHNQAQTPNKGTKSVVQLAHELNMAQDTLWALIHEAEVATINARFGPRIAPALETEAQEKLFALPYFKIPLAPDGAYTLGGLSTARGISEVGILALLKNTNLKMTEMRFKGKALDGFMPNDVAVINKLIAERESAPPEGIMSVASLADELGFTPVTMRNIVKRLEVPTFKYRFGFTVGAGLLPEDQKKIREAIALSRDETLSPVHWFAKEVHLSRPGLNKVMSELDISPIKLLVGTGYVLSEEMRRRIKEHLGIKP